MEYRKCVEEHKHTREFGSISKEEHKPGKEYFSDAEEYHMPVKEYFIGEVTGTPVKKEKHRSIRKKVRQMGYLVAASVAVMIVSQTIKPEIGKEKDWQDVQDVIEETPVINAGDIAVNVPGLDRDDWEENKVSHEYVSVSAFDRYSSANGGVFLFKQNGLWGLMNLSGEILCEPKYNGTNWWAPNDDGYSVVTHNGVYYILDNQGNEVFVCEEAADEVKITDENIIFVEQYGDFENDILAKASYWKVDGTKIAEVTSLGGDIFEPNAFNDGIAVINMSTEIGWDEPHMLFPDGTIRRIVNSEGDAPYFWVYDSAYADGYYVGYSTEGWVLVDVASGNGTEPFWPSYVVEKYVPGFVYEDARFKGYYENGQYLYNYYTYGCIEAENGEETVNILFDYRNGDWDSYNLNSVIAIYDTILMDDFVYLLAVQDEKCFYIDWNGNVVSETYVDATAFNEDGYAMVIEASGTAYLINAKFEKLDTIEGVTDVGNVGDAFGMEYNGENVIYVLD